MESYVRLYMMALTHGLASVALAAVALPVLGEHVGPAVLLVAFVGGIAPDFDVVAAHRRTLHYPVGFTVAAAVLLTAVTVVGGPGVLLAAVAATGAAVHALSDVLAGSVETEPWNPTTERAVYNHVLSRWHRPRRWVRYSGAPEDFLLAFALGAAAIVAPATGPTAEALLWACVGLAGGYTLIRRRLALGRRAVAVLPRRLRDRLPALDVTETDSGATTVEFVPGSER